MRDNVKARIDYIKKVAAGKYTLTEAEAELNKLEQEYGDDAFLPGAVVRKPKPWTKEYLRDLEEDAIAGAGSREFLHHFAEVSADVYGRARRRRALAIGGGILAAFAAIALILKWLNS